MISTIWERGSEINTYGDKNERQLEEVDNLLPTSTHVRANQLQLSDDQLYDNNFHINSCLKFIKNEPIYF